MRIGIGSDHLGFQLKELLRGALTTDECEVCDFGAFSKEPVDYPDIATSLAESVSEGRLDRGILVCGTGLGMAIAANKVPGIMAACVSDVYTARMAGGHNYAQVITLGANVVGPELALSIVNAWLLASDFHNEGSAHKVAKIMALDARYRRLDAEIFV